MAKGGGVGDGGDKSGTEAGCGRLRLHAYGWWLREHCSRVGAGLGHGHARGRGGSTGAGREQGEGTAGARGRGGLGGGRLL